MWSLKLLPVVASVASAACPYLSGELPGDNAGQNHLRRRDDADSNAAGETEEFLSQFYLNDTGAYLTTDVGGPISDQNSLSIGERGPTLLEDFIFRQKIQHFDHERVWPRLSLFLKTPGSLISRLLTIATPPGPRACSPCSRSRRPWRLHFVRKLDQYHCSLLLELSRQADTHVRADVDCCRQSRQH